MTAQKSAGKTLYMYRYYREILANAEDASEKMGGFRSNAPVITTPHVKHSVKAHAEGKFGGFVGAEDVVTLQ